MLTQSFHSLVKGFLALSDRLLRQCQIANELCSARASTLQQLRLLLQLFNMSQGLYPLVFQSEGGFLQLL